MLAGPGVFRDCDDYLAPLRLADGEAVHVVLRVVLLEMAVNHAGLAAAAARTRDACTANTWRN